MRLRWHRVSERRWEGYDEFEIVRAEVRREGAQWRWVVLDGFSDTTGLAPTLRAAQAAARRRVRPVL